MLGALSHTARVGEVSMEQVISKVRPEAQEG